MYYFLMVQPKTPPKSFRPGDERWGKIEAHAAKAGITPHAAILALIDKGLGAKVEALAPPTLDTPLSGWGDIQTVVPEPKPWKGGHPKPMKWKK